MTQSGGTRFARTRYTVTNCGLESRTFVPLERETFAFCTWECSGLPYEGRDNGEAEHFDAALRARGNAAGLSRGTSRSFGKRAKGKTSTVPIIKQRQTSACFHRLGIKLTRGIIRAQRGIIYRNLAVRRRNLKYYELIAPRRLLVIPVGLFSR